MVKVEVTFAFVIVTGFGVKVGVVPTGGVPV
jgi:hypothetical protein